MTVFVFTIRVPIVSDNTKHLSFICHLPFYDWWLHCGAALQQKLVSLSSTLPLHKHSLPLCSCQRGSWLKLYLHFSRRHVRDTILTISNHVFDSLHCKCGVKCFQTLNTLFSKRCFLKFQLQMLKSYQIPKSESWKRSRSVEISSSFTLWG